MEFKELRLGNFINVWLGSGIYNEAIVTKIESGRVYASPYSYHEYDYSLSDIKGIPITEERLVRFGFFLCFSEQKNLKYSNHEIELWGNYATGFYLLNGEEQTNWSKTYKYVHELQNLNYVLTGKELEVNAHV